MRLDPAAITDSKFYFALISCIAPRPIAWVSTISPGGVTNLAPFSFFTGITSNPPTLLFCPGNRADGTRKDTLSNIEATREFVVNVVPFSLAVQMNATSADYAPNVSEIEACAVATVPSVCVRPPRVAASPIHFECRLRQVIEVGDGNVVIGDILLIDVDDAVLDATGRIDAGKLDLVGRMGGASYTRTQDRFELPRPPAPSA